MVWYGMVWHGMDSLNVRCAFVDKCAAPCAPAQCAVAQCGAKTGCACDCCVSRSPLSIKNLPCTCQCRQLSSPPPWPWSLNKTGETGAQCGGGGCRTRPRGHLPHDRLLEKSQPPTQHQSSCSTHVRSSSTMIVHCRISPGFS